MTDFFTDTCLFIGNPEGLVTGNRLPCTFAHTFAEGLTLLKGKHFGTVYLVFSEIPRPVIQSVRILNQICNQSTLFLLAQMFDEPEVIDTIHQCGINGINYLISPIHEEELVLPPGSTKHAALSQEDKDRRIQELETLVLQDDLTGLKNRRYLRLFLPAVIQEAANSGFQVTLLLFDIDDFKHYNDTYGHSVGDRVLRQTASLISRCCRTQDVVVRLGGDEFAVVFWDRSCTRTGPETETEEEKERRVCRDHPREAFFMAERFRREMGTASFDVLGVKGKGSLTISGGLATYPKDAATSEILFEKADQAMLEAKRGGKNRLYLVGQG